jgi:alpha-L-arabinofuranosidase
MGEIDHQHRVKLVVDEWGAWHKSGSEADPTHLYGQTSTLRDALLAALTLDTFIRNADKVAMANVAQLINCLHSLFTAHEERFLLTPNYHVFDMYAAHQGNHAVRTLFSGPQVSYTRLGKPASFWGLAGSASIQQKRLVLTVVNPDTNQEREAEIAIRSASVLSGRGITLTASDIHAYNSFDNPRAVEPKESVIQSTGKTLIYRFPAASVTRLTLDLG